jgi:hypothetical protein
MLFFMQLDEIRSALALTTGSNCATPDLIILQQGLELLRVQIKKDCDDWHAAVEDERQKRLANNTSFELALAHEAKERSADDDELADDVREQVWWVV